MLTVQVLIWQCHHFSVSGKILEASESKYACGCRRFLEHANSYGSYMSQAMSSRESRRSIPGNSLWSFCDSSVTLFKVKWPPTRRFKGHIVSAGISQSYLCLLPGLTSCGLCSSESEPRKPKSGRPCILGNNSLLGREISRKWALCRLISNTDKQSMFVVLGWFRTWPKLWKHRLPKYLRLLSNGILKTVLHHADCPSAHLAASPLLCVREDFGSQWK